MIKELIANRVDVDIKHTPAYWLYNMAGGSDREVERLLERYSEAEFLRYYNNYAKRTFRYEKPQHQRNRGVLVNGVMHRINSPATTTNRITNWECLAERRVAERIKSGEYQPLPDGFPTVPNLGAHRSTQDPNLIAYYPTDRHIINDKAQQIKPGRFLRKYFPTMSDDWVRQKAAIMAPAELKFLSDWSDMLQIYRKLDSDGVVSSCMSKDNWGNIHPLMVYHDSDVELAVLFCEGKPVARALYNKHNKHYPMIYGQWEKMKVVLDNAGFVHASLCGAKIRKIKFYQGSTPRSEIDLYDNDICDEALLMPYIDYKRGLDRSSVCCTQVNVFYSYVVIQHNGEYDANRYEEGYIDTGGDGAERSECECCGDMVDPDDMYWLDEEERSVCSHCYHYNTVNVYMGTRRGSETYTRDYAENSFIYIECASLWVKDSDAAHDAGYMYLDFDDEWHNSDDVVYIEDEETYYPISEEGTYFVYDPETLEYISIDERDRRAATEQEEAA